MEAAMPGTAISPTSREAQASSINNVIKHAKRRVIKANRAESAIENVRALYRDLSLSIETVSIETLQVYKRSLRKHSTRQIKQVAESIRAFGIVHPLIVDADDQIIAGHGLLEAARLAGYSQVPIIRLEHLDAPQKKALRIALNRLAELSGWDEGLLGLEFQELLELDLSLDLSFDLAITGFAAPEIDALIVTAGADPQTEPDEDDALPGDNAGPPVTRLGDIWKAGPHKLICGDARSAEVYAALLDDERATMGIHDAPYNVKINGHVSKSGRHTEFVMASSEMSVPEFTHFLTDALTSATAYTRPGGIQFVWMDWRHMGEVLAAAAACKLELKNLCVWNKGAGALGSLYRSTHELIFVFKEPNGPHINNIQLGKFGRNRCNVWSHPGAASLRDELELHSTPKPVALIADAIRDCSNRGDIVIDAFCGSGTTIIAAAKTGRRAYTIELDPKYVDVAVKRWEAWSGEKARHAGTSLSFEQMAERRRIAARAAPEPLPPVRERRRAA
jgi:DNA modification methylase